LVLSDGIIEISSITEYRPFLVNFMNFLFAKLS